MAMSDGSLKHVILQVFYCPQVDNQVVPDAVNSWLGTVIGTALYFQQAKHNTYEIEEL